MDERGLRDSFERIAAHGDEVALFFHSHSALRIESGTVADALARRGTWRDHDAYVCGSEAMVTATVSRLPALGASPERIFIENFGWSEL